MTLPFPLADLERHLPDADRQAGEQLSAAPQEVERHLWTARYGPHEAEARISPSRVRAIGCDCSDFSLRKSCPHVAALLLAIRAQRPAPKPRPATTKTAKRLSVPGILAEAEDGALRAFLRDYARRDPAFALALKARFAGSVQLEDNRAKYRQLIEGTVRGARRADGSLTPRALKRALPVLQELLGQADDATARAAYADATDLLRAFIPGVARLVPAAGALADELRPVVLAAFARLDQLLDRSPAPALRSALWAFGIEELGKNFYRRAGLLEPLFALLLRLADEGQKREALLAVLDEQLQRPFAIPAQRTALLSVKLDLLRRTGAADAVRRLVLENLDSPQLLRGVIRAELARGRPADARALAEAGRAQTTDRWAINALDELLLEIGEVTGDTELIERYGAARFLTSFNFDYFDRLAAGLPGTDWQARLEQQLLDGDPTARRTKAIARWYARTAQYDRLLALLQTHRDLDLLLLHAAPLYAYSARETIDLLLQLTQSYLDRHLGVVPARRMTEVLRQLRRAGLAPVADRLRDYLTDTYPTRKALRKALREW